MTANLPPERMKNITELQKQRLEEYRKTVAWVLSKACFRPGRPLTSTKTGTCRRTSRPTSPRFQC